MKLVSFVYSKARLKCLQASKEPWQFLISSWTAAKWSWKMHLFLLSVLVHVFWFMCWTNMKCSMQAKRQNSVNVWGCLYWSPALCGAQKCQPAKFIVHQLIPLTTPQLTLNSKKVMLSMMDQSVSITLLSSTLPLSSIPFLLFKIQEQIV